MPDRVVLFRGPLTRMCEDVEELREEVAITVVHESRSRHIRSDIVSVVITGKNIDR